MTEMDNVIIRGARLEDVAPLALSMRESDRLEVLASHGMNPVEMLRFSLQASILAFTAEYREYPVAMFGISTDSFVGDRAAVWLLTGEVVSSLPITFVKVSRRVVSRFLELYPVLENWVDARYVKSLRWLERIGAHIDPPAPYGAEGLPFHHIVFRSEGRNGPWGDLLL